MTILGLTMKVSAIDNLAEQTFICPPFSSDLDLNLLVLSPGTSCVCEDLL